MGEAGRQGDSKKAGLGISPPDALESDAFEFLEMSEWELFRWSGR